MRILFAVLLALFTSTPMAIAGNEIAVIRDRHSPLLQQIYFGFATAMDRRFANFDAVAGKEAEIAKGIKLENARVALILGDPTPAMLTALDPKLPLVVLSHGHHDEIPNDNGQRVIVRIVKDIHPAQVLGIIQSTFPNRRRLGFAYNPKLTQSEITEYRNTQAAKEMNFVILKVDQPADLPNLMPTFKDKIDLFLLVMDATLIKAGTGAISGFLREMRIPLISTCELLQGEGTFLQMEVTPLAIGKTAAQIIQKMLAGQMTFSTNYEPRDITLTFSSKEAGRLKMTGEQFQEMLDRTLAQGYDVRLRP